ncbi:CaiB/BaiF CoA transferase family protein [Candidatus Binatus sp.]|uniref:CaiB/BaiF CoA transferase family protein n=2 Tax=Candidatus Binatus sp. TaxID=2811406 RepID=UPI003BB10E39
MARFEQYEEPPRALEGLKVVELPCLDTMPFMAASMAAKSFADFGAEVVKVEPPRTGSQERALGPFRDEMPDPETGGLHLYLNTNKLGVTIDLENPRGRDQVFDLLAAADIVFNPNRPEVNEKLGIDWRTLTSRFPKLIVVSITFFGAESAYKNLRGGDLVATHMSGVGYETPWHQVTDPKTQPPLKLGGRQSDYLTGYTAAAAAMCALYSRKSNGAGQHVDVAQWFSMISMVRPNIGFYSHEDKNSDSFQRLYSRQKRAAQWVYPCKDGWVSFNAGTDRFWRGAKKALGHPEWMDTELFNTVLGRASNIDAIEAGVIDWLSTTTRTEAFERAQAEHVPCFPVHSPAEVAGNEQYKARKFFVDLDHPAAREVRMPGAPCKFSHTPWRIVRGAPRLGEHNEKILQNRSVESGDRYAGRNLLKKPLEGIRVADFGWIFAVPHATAWLGALGADVIRIETSGAPDLVRYLTGTDGSVGANRSGVFHAINSSRRSLALNLATPEGQEIARKIIRQSDFVTENYTVGNMAKYNLAYDDLIKIKPDIIMLSGTPLGQDGPFARTVGFGPTTQAFAGLCHITGYPDSFPCGIGGTWPDFAVGTGMVFFLLAALHHRDRTGEGQYLDLSMAEMVTTMMPEAMMDFLMNGRDQAAIGNRDESMAPHGVFPVAGEDKWIAIAISSDDEFAKLCEALGVPSMAADPKFSRLYGRLANVEELEREIATRTRAHARDDLVTKLRARDLAAGPVYNTPEVINDPVFSESSMLVNLKHGEVGERAVPGLPVRFSGIDLEYRGAPMIGEHTDQLMSELLGYSPAEIARLKEAKVLI